MPRRGPARAGAHRSATLWRYALAAVLGLSGRRAPGRPDRARRDRAASSYEVPADAANPLQYSRAYQLPPFGRGNGLEALFWAPLARLPANRVDPLLRSLREQDIAAWAAAAGHGRGAGPPPADGPHDVWVASDRLEDAEEVLLRVLAA